MRIRSVLFGAAIGAALAYLFDPERGRGRRAKLRDEGMAEVRRRADELAGRARYAADRTRGRIAERVSMPETPVDDQTLVDRIRSEALGDKRIPAGEVKVDVADGVATLRGELAEAALIDEVIARVRVVPGVEDVRNLLHTPDQEPAANKRAATHASERASRSTPPTGRAIE
jgi:gas vesicle protein